MLYIYKNKFILFYMNSLENISTETIRQNWLNYQDNINNSPFAKPY